MKKIIFLFSFPAIIFVTVLILSFFTKMENEEKLKELNNFQKQLISITSELEIEKLFSNDLNLANIDLESLSQRSNMQKKFWDEFINKDINLAQGHSKKSSSTVNTEINKLLSYLSRTFEGRNIRLGKSLHYEPALFAQESQKEKNFGFGFSAYDGFWPSFDKEEANIIFIQAKIVKELCDFLLSSFEPVESFSLLSIRREAAGEEDRKFIGETLYLNSSQCYLLRDSKLVDSFVFEISFTGKTKDCRTFINQLRPPYCLRSLRVERQDLEDSEKQQFSMGVDDASIKSDILPIIRDITSIFTLVIEYIHGAKTNVQNEVSVGLPADADPEKVKEILSLFN